MAFAVLPLPSDPVNFQLFIDRVSRISLVLIFTIFFFRATDTITEILKEKAADPKHWMDTSLVPLIILALKVVVGVILFVLVIQNLGYSVSALVASLGIGGIAVALAAQGTLANFFGSLMIMIDRPFRIGDWIQAERGEYEGVVEEIGFRSTKIRTFEKTVQIIPNDKLAGMVLENMDRRKDKNLDIRRIKMTIGLEYKTTADQMESAVKAIREILEESPVVDKRQIFVYFSGFGEFSLNIFVYFYATSANWRKWLEIRHEINILIMKKLGELNVTIAFPTQSIRLEKNAGQNLSSG
jgi:MscS family membrane protein